MLRTQYTPDCLFGLATMQLITINYLFALIVVVAANPHYIPISTIEHIPNPGYSFNYAVNDPSTGDNKGQWEVRHGDNVKGSYSLVEPDGTLRVVDYHADDLTGFNAVVKRVGPAVHPTAITPIVIPEPKIIPRPILHPLTFSPLPAPYFHIPEPTPKPMVPFTTFPHPSLRNIGTFAKPIVVADPIIPIRAFDPLPIVPLMMPPEGPIHGPAPFTISGATYGKHGIVKSWSSGPINLEGKSLFIRHKH